MFRANFTAQRGDILKGVIQQPLGEFLNERRGAVVMSDGVKSVNVRHSPFCLEPVCRQYATGLNIRQDLKHSVFIGHVMAQAPGDIRNSIFASFHERYNLIQPDNILSARFRHHRLKAICHKCETERPFEISIRVVIGYINEDMPVAEPAQACPQMPRSGRYG